MQSMRISFHLGAHCTDEDQLVKSLLKNPKVFNKYGIAVPSPRDYRPVIRQVVRKLNGEPADRAAQDVLFEAMLESDDAERLVLSNEHFLANHVNAFKDAMFYKNAGKNSAALRNLFPENEVEFFIAVRNPATFIPALHQIVQPGPFNEYIAGVDPDALVWSDVIHDIREHNPGVPITVWCNEDTPLIWPEVLHDIIGLDQQIYMRGGYDVLIKIMAKEGVKRLKVYLDSHPPATEIQRRRIVSAFLDKYALEDEVEEELDLPGWTPEIVDQFTENYDDDLIEIGRIPGVTVLTA